MSTAASVSMVTSVCASMYTDAFTLQMDSTCYVIPKVDLETLAI